MAPRKKPRTNHSRAGCLTCKRRKVKCSEERPHCSRCIQGGFICNGYIDPPKAWIFYSRSDAQVQTNDVATVRSGHQTDWKPSKSLPIRSHPLALMKSGNSDPFNVYAITLGPREHDLLQSYDKILLPAFYKSRPARLVHPISAVARETVAGRLQNEAAAYALLSHEAALKELLTLRGGCRTPFMSSLGYMVKSQAVLRQRLSLMNGTETHDTVFDILWTISYLAATEVIAASPAARVHIRALHQLISRYAELVGPDSLQRTSMPILTVMLIDTVKAHIEVTRPIFNLNDWLPYLSQNKREEKSPSSSGTDLSGSVSGSISDTSPSIVEDEALRNIVLKQRELLRVYHESLRRDMSTMEIFLLTFNLHSEVLSTNELLHIAVDAEELLLKPGLSLEQVHTTCARAQLSLSVLLWSQLILPTSLANNILFDLAAPTLKRLKGALLRIEFDEKGGLSPRRAHAETRFWALYVGSQAELHREDSGSRMACGTWFLEAFRDEAVSMHVYSWQQAVNIFEQFLYSDHIKPHISEWWHKIVFIDQKWTATDRIKQVEQL